MSLINEALKRARVEAARRDASAKGVPASALPVYRPPRRRPWLAPVAGFAAGLVAVALAVGAFWLARKPLPAAAAEVTAVSAVPASGETAVAAPAPAAVPRAAAVPPPQSRQDAGAPSTGNAGATGVPSTGNAGATGGVPAAVRAVPAPAPPPPPATWSRQDGGTAGRSQTGASGAGNGASGVADGQTYFREVTLAGGTPIKVDFIVWSVTRPFAQINGQLLNPGQSAGDYTLLEVERERVQLESGSVRFWIRVR